ncbi:unnamed protein product, partial [Mesorhabditis spiculigera]
MEHDYNEQDNYTDYQARQQRALCRWLLIALVCVLLNTPENTLRLITLFGMPDFQNSGWHLSARMLAQALYFSQFAFNAIYLALFVYDKSSRSKHVHDGSNYNSHAIHLIFAEAFMQHFAAHATSPRSKRAKMVLPPLLRSRRASTCCESPPHQPRVHKMSQTHRLHPQLSLTTSRSYVEIPQSQIAELHRSISEN